MLSTHDGTDVRETARAVRRLVLEQSMRAGVGHIGSSLSVVDILTWLYSGELRLRDDRDRFLLSKGHAALALYCTLFATGRLSDHELATFCSDGTKLGVHPDHGLEWVDFSTGSLGQGLSVGVGAALAARMSASPRRVFVLLSDAELNEGAVWEAAMFAAHHRLANLVAIVDVNGQQAFGLTREVLSLEPLGQRWEAQGWKAIEVDGHDVEALAEAVARPADTPRVLLARTTFGRGVSFMENRVEWHYLPMTEEQYKLALAEINAA